MPQYHRSSALLAALSCVLAAGEGLHRPPARVLSQVRQSAPQRETQALAQMRADRLSLGLGMDEDFRPSRSFTDAFAQTHVRLQHTYRGLPVWGSEAIVHMDAEGTRVDTTLGLRSAAKVGLERPEAVATFGPEQALAAVTAHLGPKASRLELVTAPVQAWFPARQGHRLPLRRAVPGGPLATDPDFGMAQRTFRPGALFQGHHLTVQWERDGELRRGEFVVDAATGEVRDKWNGLQSLTADGTGNSFYNGPVPLKTTQNGAQFELKDLSRPLRPHPKTGALGNLIIDWQNGGVPSVSAIAPSILSKLYMDADNVWGDGNPYDIYQNPLPATSSENGKTTAADAHFGLSATWDMYAKVFGRLGLDDQGTSTMALVHVRNGSNTFVNAFWDSSTFTMFFGDGGVYNQVWSLTSPDITAHELTHGVTQWSAGLVYSGESGGLNEANSDIFGKMLEFYIAGGLGGDRIPEVSEVPVGHPSLSWQIGNRISMLPTDPPLRYMIRPSLDGVSPDHWNPRIEALDVHYNSGPMNRAFYFLSQGASSLKGAIDHSGALPGGMVGIGNHKAATIWYRALTTRLTAYSGYAEARAATLICAEELFGAGSPEATAVKNAFAAIGVGPAAGQAPGSEIRFWVQGPDQPEVHNGNWNPANPEIQYLVASGYSLQLNGTAQNLPSNAGTWSMAPGAQGEAAGRVEASGLYRSSGLPYTAIVRGASVHDGDLMDLAYIVPVQVDINGDREVDGEDLGIFVLSYNSAATVGNQGTNYTEAADFLSRGIIDNITGLFLLDVFKTTTFK